MWELWWKNISVFCSLGMSGITRVLIPTAKKRTAEWTWGGGMKQKCSAEAKKACCCTSRTAGWQNLWKKRCAAGKRFMAKKNTRLSREEGGKKAQICFHCGSPMNATRNNTQEKWCSIQNGSLALRNEPAVVSLIKRWGRRPASAREKE